MTSVLDISTSALAAQRARMDVIAGNIANAEATEQPDGRPIPYRRKVVTLATGDDHGGPGLHVAAIAEDASPFRLVYDPGHADAIREGPQAGYVQYPNVNVTMEYVDAMAASRAYEANLAMLNLSRNMAQQALRLFA
ncbi:MAG: flagellar basal body rod protein FlgC [Phycisphaerae bacterium]